MSLYGYCFVKFCLRKGFLVFCRNFVESLLAAGCSDAASLHLPEIYWWLKH